MPEFSEERLEQEILTLGSAVLEQIQAHQRSRLDPQFYTDKLMEFAMRDEALKVSLFRFVDVLPSLDSASSVIRHVQEYFEPVKDRIPGFLQRGFSVSPDSLTSVVVAKAIRQQVRFIADRFIVGETADKAIPALRKIRKQGLAFTVDLVGEAALGQAECREYLDRYKDLLEKLGKATRKWPEAEPIVEGHKAEISPINISVKLSALYSQAKPISTDSTVGFFHEQLTEILSKAKEVGAFVYIDMEDTSLVSPTLEAVKKTLSHPVFRDYSRCGIVLQAYLRRTEKDFEELLPWIRKRGVPIGIRLVKGAYWDTENIYAVQQRWPVPVWQTKRSSDANYEKLSRRLLEEVPLILPAFGSHNVRSLVHACAAAKLGGIPTTEFELQSLYGMGPEVKKAFTDRGFLVREYSPVGALIPGMGYLVRRLLENTSNEGFLRRSTFEKVKPELLLKPPAFDERDTGDLHLKNLQGFHNSPLIDFSIPAQRERVAAALAQFRAAGTTTVYPLVAGAELKTTDSIRSTSPEDTEFSVAKVFLATADDAAAALEKLKEYFPTWAKTPIADRAAVLKKAAELMEANRPELIATIVYETGKPVLEADGDVAEAIDFCAYYAEQAESLFVHKKLRSPLGELNSYWFEPRGVAAVICPWNFPLAIPCGMFAAALVCGNTVVLKPAEQSSLVASKLFSIFLDAGMPVDAAAFLPGRGEEVGALLGVSPTVETICFTGSKQVGLQLIEVGVQRENLGRHVRRVIAEMGGKNAIIVDEDADLDEAVKGVLSSAFGFAGQKCSACSRVIVVGSAYSRFCTRLADAIQSIKVGQASDFGVLLGPVIDRESKQRLDAIIQQAKFDCKVLAENTSAHHLQDRGTFVNPIAFTEIPEGHSLLVDELFGPVLAVIFADSFSAALANAMNSEYALTGAVFSRSPRNIHLALEQFKVGNLYLNRGSTGAIVGRQPFGGAAMSGVGSKAGGPDYLQQFVIPRSASENTVRRGFAPIEG